MHLRGMSREMLKISILHIDLQVTNLRIQPNFPEANLLINGREYETYMVNDV